MSPRPTARTISAFAAIAAFVLAGCSSSTDEPQPAQGSSSTDDPQATQSSSSASTPDSAPPLDDETALSQSICSRVDQAAYAKALGEEVVYSLAANGATRSLPISDSCSMDIGKKVDEGSAEAAAYSTSVGWSVDTVDADGWQEIKDYWEKVQGQYVDIVASKAGDDGFIVFHTGYALVGDRVVSVRYSGPSIKTGQVDAALREVVKATDPLPDPVLKRAPEDCAALDDLAAEVMGAPSVITRGSADDELSCTWGTSETALGLSGDTTAQAQEEVSILKDFGARRIDGLGTLAYLADDVDGTTLQWATEGGTLVSIGTATGIRAAKKPLLALAKAAQEYYR